ncbi:MAG: hypothetical protein V3S30_05230 [Thermoanaerobaculia bacterium]
MKRRVVWPVVVGTFAMLVLVFWRRYLWHHALMVSLAAAALTYSVGRSVEQLRDRWKK